MRILNHEDLSSFVETQLATWPLAKKNYDALREVKRREIDLNGFNIGVQFNPARILSTGASVDKDSIKSRPCFLCSSNRPEEQLAIEIHPGWQLLVNPYPILPIHFTIASVSHRDQDRLPDDIVAIAENLPGMAVFFNGARAGASAPDHMHLQAVLKEELPLLRLAEKFHKSSEPGLWMSSDFVPEYPYLFFSGVVDPSAPDCNAVLSAGLMLGGPDCDGRFTDQSLLNAFFWIGENGELRYLSVPRKAHRPNCYFAEGGQRLMVSPGCIDMAGIIITPREEDFTKIESKDLLKIFDDVAIH